MLRKCWRKEGWLDKANEMADKKIHFEKRKVTRIMWTKLFLLTMDKANERARAKQGMENPTSDTPIICFDYMLEQL